MQSTNGTMGRTTVTQRSTVTQNFATKRKKKRSDKNKNGTEEKEFADLTTRKNLLNVQSKLDRGMSELQREIFPLLIMDRQPGDIDIPVYLGGRSGSKGSNASMRRSSFGSAAAENHAKHMTSQMQDLKKGG